MTRWPSVCSCDHGIRARSRRQVQQVQYYAPTWFVRLEISIRLEALPIHFCIQTPRVVPSLKYLYKISFDEFKVKLSTREITLQDVESDGYSVLHVSLPCS